MKIAILTLGTRGDVEPYAVLGQALKNRGHRVILSTAKNFEALVKSYELEFVPVEADFQALLNSEEGKKMLKGNPFAIKRNLNTWVYPLISNALSEFYTLARTSDKVIYHVKTLADSFADQFPEKMIRASVLPIIEPTKEFSNPALSGLPIPKLFNRMSFTLANLSTKLLSKPIKSFREQYNLSKKYKVPKIQNLYGISPTFLPVPKDYPTPSIFTGFWFGSSVIQLSLDLLDFIHQETPPLLLTFGSMPFKSKFDLQNAIIKITTELQTRIIVVKGWGLDATDRLENRPSIKIINSAPYEKLFPLVKAIIHHGGIGTTAACLKAGKPFMICPILYPIGDQKFWGQLAYKKQVAVQPIPISKMTESKFLRSIKELLTNQKLYDTVEMLKKGLDTEDGLQNAIELIETHPINVSS